MDLENRLWSWKTGRGTGKRGQTLRQRSRWEELPSGIAEGKCRLGQQTDSATRGKTSATREGTIKQEQKQELEVDTDECTKVDIGCDTYMNLPVPEPSHAVATSKQFIGADDLAVILLIETVNMTFTGLIVRIQLIFAH